MSLDSKLDLEVVVIQARSGGQKGSLIHTVDRWIKDIVYFNSVPPF
jgi:hypothetical protein